MISVNGKDFGDWDAIYKEVDLEAMPWFSAELDADLREAIRRLGASGGNFLDLGTGPGTQAIELQKIGFNATGSDISESAVARARSLGKATFVADDVLDSKLPESSFDYVLDRGCFHGFDSQEHQNYIRSIKKILRPQGYFFLKCMSAQDAVLPEGVGVNKYSRQQIEEIFSNDFDIEDIKDTVYHGTMKTPPRAMFCTMRKK